MHCARIQFWLPLFAVAIAGCTPPELTGGEEELVARCLELAHKQETSDECGAVTRSMEKAYLDKHPDFYDRLLAARKALVEERIAEDRRRSEEISRCADVRAAGETDPKCEKFTSREIERVMLDRRLRGCAAAKLDEAPDAEARCAGLTEQEIEDEVRAERIRRGAL
jgi:hypothetical protein